MGTEGVIEGVCTDCVVCIKQVSIRSGGGGGRSRPSDKGGDHQDPEIRGGAWS